MHVGSTFRYSVKVQKQCLSSWAVKSSKTGDENNCLFNILLIRNLMINKVVSTMLHSAVGNLTVVSGHYFETHVKTDFHMTPNVSGHYSETHVKTDFHMTPNVSVTLRNLTVVSFDPVSQNDDLWARRGGGGCARLV
jgi:hypothetical protein